MMLTMLKAKLHRATITHCDLNYVGSISIDAGLMKKCGILPNEQVDVYNLNNGARFTTYAIEAEEGSGIIGVNGAGARLAHPGDLVIICCYASMEEAKAKSFEPAVIQIVEGNKAL